MIKVFILLIIVYNIGCFDFWFDDKIDDCCSGTYALLCKKCWNSCPLRENGIENLRDVLSSRIFGQDHVIDKLVNTLQSRDGNKPSVFHFAGDNGVGKTLTTKTIAEALFSVKDFSTGTYKGMLYLRGNHYCDKYKDNKQVILDEILDQLYICPDSLIIFDEAELPSIETMQVFEELFDENESILYKGKEIIKSRAIFILISDFGIEGVTEGMSIEEIESLIHKDTINTWKHSKQVNTVNNIIPFLPMEKPLVIKENEIKGVDYDREEYVVLTINNIKDYINVSNINVPESVKKQILYLVLIQSIDPPIYIKNNLKLNIDNIEIDENSLNLLSKIIYYNAITSIIYESRNYRGIEQLFQTYIIPKIVNHLIDNKNKYIKMKNNMESINLKISIIDSENEDNFFGNKLVSITNFIKSINNIFEYDNNVEKEIFNPENLQIQYSEDDNVKKENFNSNIID
jgi:DNA polymerase III delta prime subunit